jgi:hypothetical protein
MLGRDLPTTEMSRRDGEMSTSKDDASRAHPGRGRFLRGSTWAIGDYTPSKQVNCPFNGNVNY